MNYVEIAIKTPSSRGVLIPKANIKTFIKTDEPLYRSMYTYDDEAKNFVDDKGSIKDYYGTRSIDNVLIDIDRKDNSDQFTLDKVKGLLFELEDNFEVNPMKSAQVYFSGSGYHISLPGGLFNFTDSPDLPFFVKATMDSLFDGIDLMIYMRPGIYRVQHTVNLKTGLYKIPLTYKEVHTLTPEAIQTLAKGQRLDYPYTELLSDGELEDRVIKNAPRIKQFKAVAEPINMVPCVQKMLTAGPNEGNRNNTIMRIASHFRRHGIPSEYAKVSLLHWNNNSLNEEIVINKTEQTYDRGYKYSCNDPLMKENCRTNCIFFKRKDYDVEVKDALTLQEEYTNRLATDFAGRTLNLGGMLGLDNNTDATIYPGELVTIFGPTGSNKTTLAQNIALGVDMVNDCIRTEWQIPTLFLSLELSGWYMHRRHLQIVSGLSKDEINVSPDEVFKCHEAALSHMNIQTISPTLDQIRKKVQELQPAVVVVDYIDLVETPPHIRGEYEQIKYISHTLSNMAVNMDIIIIQISQVAREYSRNDVLDLYAGKGSGAIENASRKVIGLQGQANSDIKNVEMFKNTDGELFKAQVQWRPSFRLRRTYNDDNEETSVKKPKTANAFAQR